jgi:GNAT superfamily N-acetyltransferase
MTYSIRQVDASHENIRQILVRLHKDTFIDPLPDFLVGTWWIAYCDETPVGFCGLTSVASWPNAGYLSRTGVLLKHRGKGLQKRLIKVRASKARKDGLQWLISATYNNVPSSNSLIGCGFKMYKPNIPWLASGSLYWRKKL